MLANERQNKIHEMLIKNGAVTTNDLVKKFRVSIETVRRDLLFMEQSKLLKRVHGGAVKAGEMIVLNKLDARVEENRDKKRELSEIAVKFINEGDIIGVDAGSTAILFAEVLKENFSSLTVITHSLDVFEIIGKHRNFNVILCGGHFMKEENSFYGRLALNTIENLHMQKCFVCPSAVSLKFGVCDYNQELVQIQQKFMECSDEVFFLADSGKFEKNALLKLCDMKPEHTFITDGGLSDELKNIYKENQIKVFTGEEK